MDRVTRDGPRDVLGEAKEKALEGAFYDIRRDPTTLKVTEAEARYLDKISSGSKLADPVERYNASIGGLKEHLEENYDYAKLVESAIDSQR